MTEQQTKHKARCLEAEHMTPSKGWQTPHQACPQAQGPRGPGQEEEAECSTTQVRKPCLFCGVSPLGQGCLKCCNLVNRPPSPLGMLKNSLVSHKRSHQIPPSLDEMIAWMEMNLPLPSPTCPAAPCIFLIAPFSLSGIRVIRVHACLSSPLDSKPERLTRCILHLPVVGANTVEYDRSF